MQVAGKHTYGGQSVIASVCTQSGRLRDVCIDDLLVEIILTVSLLTQECVEEAQDFGLTGVVEALHTFKCYEVIHRAGK